MKEISLFRIVSLASLVLLGSGIAKASPFNDVSASHANSDAIEYVQANGIVEGYSDGNFKPDNTINRAEFTKIIVSAQFDMSTIENCVEQNIQAGQSTIFFQDIPKDAWFAKYICVAKTLNIINGYSDGRFRPNKFINFVEASKIVVSAFGHKMGSDAIWYKPFVDKLGELKAIPDTIKSFNHFVTRGEMAEMVYRLITELTTKDSMNYELIQNPPTEPSAIFDTSTSQSTMASAASILLGNGPYTNFLNLCFPDEAERIKPLITGLSPEDANILGDGIANATLAEGGEDIATYKTITKTPDMGDIEDSMILFRTPEGWRIAQW